MKNTLETIGFESVRQALGEHARSNRAKKKIATLSYYETKEELEMHLQDTSHAKLLLETYGQVPLATTEFVAPMLEKFESGLLAEPSELQQMADFMKGVRQLSEYLDEDTHGGLSDYRSALYYPANVYDEIDRCIRSGELVDEASTKLGRLRRKLKKIKPDLKVKTQATLNSNKKYMSENVVVKREGRWCVPVMREHQHRIRGTKINSSSTGATVFIEPDAVTKLQDEYFDTKMEHYQEEAKIIAQLMDNILEHKVALLENVEQIVMLDFIFAKGKLSQEYFGVKPQINTGRVIQINQGRHPSLSIDVAVPLDFTIGANLQGVIITGPNTGGKTVAIKTVSILTVMANMGLHVPAQFADIGFGIKVLCDIGDGQSIENNLSTFSAHITNVLAIFDALDEQTLVVMDELGSGTDPMEGMGIAIAILEELRIRGSHFLVTTHYPEVKEYANRHPEISNARMAFDRENLQPRYLLEQGKSGESSALYIAKRLGVPQSMLKVAAKEAYGEISSAIKEELDI